MRQMHTDYWVLWRKRDGMATLLREEHADPCLDRLLLLFWALTLRMILTHYAQVRCRRLQKTKERMSLIT